MATSDPSGYVGFHFGLRAEASSPVGAYLPRLNVRLLVIAVAGCCSAVRWNVGLARDTSVGFVLAARYAQFVSVRVRSCACGRGVLQALVGLIAAAVLRPLLPSDHNPVPCVRVREMRVRAMAVRAMVVRSVCVYKMPPFVPEYSPLR